ncbi:putative peptidyl-prolyl cis-trans isomerase [Phycisphaerales bacterium]|nr:putative peptidyl-prolyl cis-trans isomerase [Phycisphaerales bacterium]
MRGGGIIARMHNRRRWTFLCAATCVAGMAWRAGAQLTPDRTYYGVNRAMPMKVETPSDPGGEARIDLFPAPGSGAEEGAEVAPVSTAPVAPGAVNLASLFPSLWSDPTPRLLYAQLVVGESRMGPPVVLRPMLSPSRAMVYSMEAAKPYYVDPTTRRESIDPKKGDIVYTPDPAAYTGICAYVDKNVVFDTTEGPIEFRMRPDQAPNTVWNFLKLVEGGFYTDIIFHRVVPKTAQGNPFVIQVGDPTGTGDGGPGYAIDLEPSKLPHDFGVISMARDADPNTNGCQVFVCLSREGTMKLDGKYTAFGEAVSGERAILAIGATPVKGDRPVNPPVLLGARLVDAPPLGTGPRPVKRPADADRVIEQGR